VCFNATPYHRALMPGIFCEKLPFPAKVHSFGNFANPIL
jgi:hypothetical protein